MAMEQKDSPKKIASEHLKNADRLLKASQLQEALQEIEQALAIDPRNAYALAYQQRIRSAMEQAPKTAQAIPAPPPKVEVKETPKIEPKEQPKVEIEEAKKPIRKLAAIMFTDIVGYTALTQRDETLSLQLLEEHRRLLRPVFTKHEGKEIKTLGDSFLVEFTSVLQAVRCGLEVQDSMVQYNNTATQEHQMQIRIGIHIGDVVYQENDIFGDGVNIASRLQERADVGGICISQDVYSQIRTKGEFQAEYVGEVELKNVLTPIPLYKVLTKQELAQRATDMAMKKAKEGAILEARNKKLLEYIRHANDLIVKGSFNEAIVDVMNVQVIVPDHHEIKDLEERVRKGKRAGGLQEVEEKKKVPKEHILEMYTSVVQQAFSAGELTTEERNVLENLRDELGIDRKSTRLNSSHIQKSRMPSSA